VLCSDEAHDLDIEAMEETVQVGRRPPRDHDFDGLVVRHKPAKTPRQEGFLARKDLIKRVDDQNRRGDMAENGRQQVPECFIGSGFNAAVLIFQEGTYGVVGFGRLGEELRDEVPGEEGRGVVCGDDTSKESKGHHRLLC